MQLVYRMGFSVQDLSLPHPPLWCFFFFSEEMTFPEPEGSLSHTILTIVAEDCGSTAAFVVSGDAI